MTTLTPPRRARWWVLLLATLAAVLGLLLPGGAASASGVSTAGSQIGSVSPLVTTIVRPTSARAPSPVAVDRVAALRAATTAVAAPVTVPANTPHRAVTRRPGPRSTLIRVGGVSGDLWTTDQVGVAAETEGVLVEGAGSGTRSLNFRSNASDPNWGLTGKHLDKHLFGDGPMSLRSIDPGGTTDDWVGFIQDLAGRPSTASLKGGIEDIIGTFPRAGGGSFQFGIRIAPGENGSWDLVTLLTKQ